MNIDLHARFFIVVSPSNIDGTMDVGCDFAPNEVFQDFDEACEQARIECQNGCHMVVYEVMPLRRFDKVVVDVTEFAKPRRVKKEGR